MLLYNFLVVRYAPEAELEGFAWFLKGLTRRFVYV